jgi:hypothetical protein
MAIPVQVMCINKSDRYNPHERILNIGGVNPDRTRWKMSQERAIESIEKGTYTFFVLVKGGRVNVVVAKSASGHKYLRTEADNEQSNNLLNLPECP